VQFSPDLTRIISAALIVYFPILLLVGLGLRNVPLSLLDVIASNGGGSWTVFKMLRVRYALAALVGGLQAAAPLAILGSMLGELTGARWGMGSYLLATMVQANPQKEWGVFIVCSALAALAYLAVGLLFRPLLSPFAVSDASSAELDAPSSKEYLRESHWTHGILSIVASLISWQIVAYWLNNPFFLKSPLQIVLYAIHLTLNQWSMVLTALTQTMEWAGFGLVVGVGAAVVLAAAFDLVPSLVPSLLPFAVLSQTVPIVALIPLVVSAFGRGFWATMVITVFATFFPSFVTLRQGLERTPPSFLDVLRASGATQHQLLFRVKLPNSVPFAYAALRLAAPKVLLGITMAEYFVTRRGLGSLMFEARGTLDFGMMWIIAVVTGVISLTLYELFHQLEVKRGAKYQTARASV
jgi:ABC-type nitrate/sulfonate/bicarbonate transport system permease component